MLPSKYERTRALAHTYIHLPHTPIVQACASTHATVSAPAYFHTHLYVAYKLSHKLIHNCMQAHIYMRTHFHTQTGMEHELRLPLRVL
jgi:hypothetical protein